MLLSRLQFVSTIVIFDFDIHVIQRHDDVFISSLLLLSVHSTVWCWLFYVGFGIWHWLSLKWSVPSWWGLTELFWRRLVEQPLCVVLGRFSFTLNRKVLSSTSLNRLQLVQNTAATLLSISHIFSHNTPFLAYLQWLPFYFPPIHALSGLTVIAHVIIKVFQQNNRVARWGALQHTL